MEEAFLISKSVIDESLAQEPQKGKRLLEPLKSLAAAHRFPINILEDHEVTTNAAEVHLHEADIWYCLEGEVEFVYGGELVGAQRRKRPDGTENENELFAPLIAGGTSIRMMQGDWLWMPAGVPHQHNASATARMAIIKIPRTAGPIVR